MLFSIQSVHPLHQNSSPSMNSGWLYMDSQQLNDSVPAPAGTDTFPRKPTSLALTHPTQ